MRVMVDSNVLLSALIFPGRQIGIFMETVLSKHTLILADKIITEIKSVIAKKCPDKISVLDNFLATVYFEYQHIPDINHWDIKGTDIIIRDENDRFVLYAAMIAEVDVLVTGDKDFFERKYHGLEIMTPIDFMKSYG